MRRGSVSLEAALAAAGFLAAAAAAFFAILASTASTRAGMALERTARLLALGSVAADALGTDRAEAWVRERLAAGAEETWADGAGTAATRALSDLAASLSLDLALPVLYDLAFESGAGEGDGAARWVDGEGPARWRLSCEVRLSEARVLLTVRYGFRTPFGTIPQRRTCVAPLWNDGDGTRDERGGSNVWELGNLARGRAIRIRFGGNLPLGYPCLAAFRDGRATAIHSMDLSPYGWRDAAEASEEIRSRLRALAAFDGTAEPWGTQPVDIPPGSIVERRFLLVVPSNVDEDRFAGLFAEAAAEAASLGVFFDVARYQERRAPVATE